LRRTSDSQTFAPRQHSLFNTSHIQTETLRQVNDREKKDEAFDEEGYRLVVRVKLSSHGARSVVNPDESIEAMTPAEWKVMKIVWRQKGCAARAVYTEAGRALAWAPTTAKSVLRRLVEKGHLTTTQVGNSFLYRPAESAVKSLLAAADALLDNVLDGTTGLVLTHMVEKSQLSDDELAKLRKLLDARRPIPRKTGRRIVPHRGRCGGHVRVSPQGIGRPQTGESSLPRPAPSSSLKCLAAATINRSISAHWKC
jgi:BlaI family transcriptional regulator, penicillinase repressor